MIRHSTIPNQQTHRNRKHEFKLDSYILLEGGRRVFIKKATTAEAVGALKEIAARENKAKEFFKDTGKVITGTLKGDCIHYPFLDFPSLESLIDQSICNGEMSVGANYISDYIRFLQRLPAVEFYPLAFIDKFHIPSSHISNPIKCFTSGPIDCIPSNILVDKSSWYILDHEWFFDFPIPADLLIYRGIISLMSRLQLNIRAATCKQCPAALYDGYGKMRNYIPLSWLNLLREATTIPLHHLADWNWLFQKQILLYEKRPHLRLRGTPKHYVNIKPHSMEILLSESYKYLVKRYNLQVLSNYIVNLKSKLLHSR